MKKIMMTAVTFLSVLVIAGCSNNNNDDSVASTTKTSESTVVSSEKQEEQATIVLQEDDKEISSKEVTFTDDDSLYDVMKNNFELEDDDGFITSIDGHEQDEKAQKYWTFTINDKEIMKGAKEVSLKSGDKVDFSLAEMK